MVVLRLVVGALFLDGGGLLNRGFSLYTIQHPLFNYFPTQMKREENTDLFVSPERTWDRGMGGGHEKKKREFGWMVMGVQRKSGLHSGALRASKSQADMKRNHSCSGLWRLVCPACAHMRLSHHIVINTFIFF